MGYLSQLRAVVGATPLFSVGASAVVQDEQGRVLLQQRGDDGLWGFPGGSLEPGETLERCARRELQEEAGLDAALQLWRLVSGAPLYHRYPNGDEVYVVGGLCRGRLPAAALQHARPDDSGETLALRWFALDKLPAISASVNLETLSLLRAEENLPALPLPAAPPCPPSGHLHDLRRQVGTRPLIVPGASVLLRNAVGQVLLRRAQDGSWRLPGGALELGETFEAAARRTLRCDTGLDSSELQPLGVFAGPAYRVVAPNGDVSHNVSQLFGAPLQAASFAEEFSTGTQVAWAAPQDLWSTPLCSALTRDQLRAAG